MNKKRISRLEVALFALVFALLTSCTEQKKNASIIPVAGTTDTTKAALLAHQEGDVWLYELSDVLNSPDGEDYEAILYPKLTVDIKQNVLILNGKYKFPFTRKKQSTNTFFYNDTTLRRTLIDIFKAEKIDISRSVPCFEFEKYTDRGFKLDNFTYKGMLIGTDKCVCLFYRYSYPLLFKRIHVKDRSLVNVTYSAAVKTDEVRIPTDREKDITIILPALYRDEPVSKYLHMKNETWYDFYQNRKKQFMLSKARIKITSEYDDCAATDGAQILSNRECIFLIHGITPQHEKVYTLKNFPSLIYPGDVQQFYFGGETYELSASGDCTGNFIRTFDYVCNYKLYLTKAGSPYKQLLAAIPSFNDTQPNILWIGDMDGDNKPDFVLDLSENYEEKTIALLLSSKASVTGFVRCVGYSSYQFDC